MTDAAELKKWREAEPFRPFEILLDDGRRALIRNPWNVGWSAERQFVMFAWGEDDVDSVSFDRVREIRAARGSRSNSKSSRKRKRGGS